MKIRKYKPEETLGLIVGVILFFIVTILILAIGTVLKFNSQIIIWVTSGLIVLMLIIGHYIVSRKVIDEKTRNEDIIAFESNLIGYFLWLIVLIIADSLNIEINSVVIVAGGYITILLILIYMSKRANKEKEVTE